MKRIIPAVELEAIRKFLERESDALASRLIVHIDGIEDFVTRLMLDYSKAVRTETQRMRYEKLISMSLGDLLAAIDLGAKTPGVTWLELAARVLCERDRGETNFDTLAPSERSTVSAAIEKAVPLDVPPPRPGYRLTVCFGEAHSNAHIDHCLRCAPRWGWVEISSSCLTVFEAQRKAVEQRVSRL